MLIVVLIVSYCLLLYFHSKNNTHDMLLAGISLLAALFVALLEIYKK